MPVGLTCTENFFFSRTPLLRTLAIRETKPLPPRAEGVRSNGSQLRLVSYFQPRPQGFSPPICFKEKPWERGTRLSHFLWT